MHLLELIVMLDYSAFNMSFAVNLQQINVLIRNMDVL